MERLSGVSGNRKFLLKAEHAACAHCLEQFHPSEITEWCDFDAHEVGQTAQCPRCGVDGVVAFNGTLDHVWLKQLGASHFS